MADEPLLTVEAAQAAVLDGLAPLDGLEASATAAALGRVLGEPVDAGVSLPPWDNSAMDGYAIRAADTSDASEAEPARLRVDGEVAAGVPSTATVGPGTAVRIATGAPVPPGADAVVPVEQTTPLDDAGAAGPRGRNATGPLPSAILVHVAVAPGASIRAAGGDVRAGQRLLEPGTVIGPAAIALAAGAGVSEVRVRRRPRVAVLATGDEIRGPGEPLGPAGIPDANGPGLRALVQAAGSEVIDLGIARDVLDDVLERLRRGIAEADAVIVSGGVSVGPYDVVKLAFETVGRVGLWRVAVQPGKPFAFGRAPAPDGRPVLLFGLPGNPVSSFVTFELFVRPVLRTLAGHRTVDRPLDRATLVEPVAKSEGRRGYQRVVAERDSAGRPVRDEAGRVRVRLAGGQGSHVISALAVAEALAVVPEPFAVAPAGTPVDLLWLDRD